MLSYVLMVTCEITFLLFLFIETDNRTCLKKIQQWPKIANILKKYYNILKISHESQGLQQIKIWNVASSHTRNQSFILELQTGSVDVTVSRLDSSLCSQPVVAEGICLIGLPSDTQRGETLVDPAAERATVQPAFQPEQRLSSAGKTANYHDGSPGERRSLDPMWVWLNSEVSLVNAVHWNLQVSRLSSEFVVA